MRVRNNFKEDKEQELRDKIKTTILITAIAVTPAAIIHKIDQIKIDAMMTYYETVIEEEKEKSYMQGFLDGLFGPEENYLIPVDEVKDNIIETNDLVIELPEKEPVKKLVYTKNNIKY